MRHDNRRNNRRFSIAWVPAAVLLAAYYLLRNNKKIMIWFSDHAAYPARQWLTRLFSKVPFSVAEVIIAVVAVWAVVYIVKSIVIVFSKKHSAGRGRRLIFRFSVLVTVILYVLAAYGWLWAGTYFTKSFLEKSAITLEDITESELYTVTLWFAENANSLSQQVARDETGSFAESKDKYFRQAETLYDQAEKEFTCLKGETGLPKKVVFSYFMSLAGYTGAYFPFTGEANINVLAPAAFQPAVIAHELAHQRGVVREDEANFVGIMACLSSDNITYEYSGYLFGLVHLSNALYKVNPELYRQIRATFCQELEKDWTDNNDYWEEMRGPVEKFTDKIYDDYLKHNGQTSGIASYGECVNLLVTYYFKPARAIS